MSETIKKKPKETEVENEVVEEAPVANDLTLNQKMAALGVMMRERAKEVLEFDSEAANIDYTYVDTQQYKDFLGACVDACGLTVDVSFGSPVVNMGTNAKGNATYMATVECTITYSDPASDVGVIGGNFRMMTSVGMGISVGGGYAMSIACTNAMRTHITNSFMLRTNDRDGDDIRANDKLQSSFLTDDAKKEKRENLLKNTEVKNDLATLLYGNVVYTRANEVLKNGIKDEKFSKVVTTFLERNYKDGKPIPSDEYPDRWIVSSAGASKLLGDLDEYGS